MKGHSREVRYKGKSRQQGALWEEKRVEIRTENDGR